MKKQSPFTPFIAHGIRKMAESGITNLHTKRYIASEPNCKPLKSKGRPLGLEKLAFLFIFYAIGCFISLIILVVENIVKRSKPISQKESPDESMILQKIESMKREIDSFTNNEEVQLYMLQKIKLSIVNRHIARYENLGGRAVRAGPKSGGAYARPPPPCFRHAWCRYAACRMDSRGKIQSIQYSNIDL